MTTQVRKNVMDMFIDGARRGFTIATTSLLPNVVMAFVIIQALKVTGLLEVVGRVCEPASACAPAWLSPERFRDMMPRCCYRLST